MRGDCIVPRVDAETPWAIGLDREEVELLLQGIPDRPPAPALVAAPRLEPADLSIDTGVGANARYVGIFALEVALWVGVWNGVGAGEAWGLGLAAVGAAGTLALVVPELKAGLRRTFGKLGPVHFFAFCIPAFAALMGTRGWNLPFVALFLASVPMLLWARLTGPRLKGIRDFAKGAPVFESNDVQFTLMAPEEAQAGPGEAVLATVLAQNCVDAERKLVLEVVGEAQAVIVERTQSFSLMPGCVVELVVPVRPQPAAPPVFSVGFDFRGEGTEKGPRVRLEQGTTWVTPADALGKNLIGALTLVTVGVGAFSFGSSGRMRIRVDATKPFVDEPRFTTVRTVYQPTADELERAAKS